MSTLRGRRNALVDKNVPALWALADACGEGVTADAVRKLAKVAETSGDVRHMLGDVLAHVAPARRNAVICKVAIIAAAVNKGD